MTDKDAHDTLTTMRPVRSLAAYWPYATIGVGLHPPRDAEESGWNARAYAKCCSLTAFMLYRNGIIQEGDVMDANTLPKVLLPNRNGFIPRILQTSDEHKRGCKARRLPVST